MNFALLEKKHHVQNIYNFEKHIFFWVLLYWYTRTSTGFPLSSQLLEVSDVDDLRVMFATAAMEDTHELLRESIEKLGRATELYGSLEASAEESAVLAKDMNE